MNNKNVGFLGGGRITRVFLEGWHRAGRLRQRSWSAIPTPRCWAG